MVYACAKLLHDVVQGTSFQLRLTHLIPELTLSFEDRTLLIRQDGTVAASGCGTAIAPQGSQAPQLEGADHCLEAMCERQPSCCSTECLAHPSKASMIFLLRHNCWLAQLGDGHSHNRLL